MKREIDIVEGPIFKNLLWFSMPVMLTGLLQTFYNAADSIVVGRFAGSHALAAVGGTGQLVYLMICWMTGLSVGASVCVAHYVGAGDKQRVHDAVHTAIGTAIAAGLLLTVIGVCFSRTFLVMMRMPEDVLGEASLYLKILFLGMPANLTYNFGSGVLRSYGDSKHPLIFLTISGVLNVLLNLFFVIVVGMGAAGVAIATILSQIVSAAMTLWFLAKKTEICKLRFRKIRIHGQYFKQIVRIGLPAGAQSAILSFCNVVIQSMINGFGTTAIAGNAAAMNLENFSEISMYGISQALISFVGQNVGAGRLKRLRPIMGFGCLQVMMIWALVGGSTLLFLRPLLGLYAPNNPEVVQFGITRCMCMIPIYFLCGLMDALAGGLRGMGNSLLTTMTTLTSVCGVRFLWIFTVFQKVHTLPSLYVCYPLSWMAAILLLGVLMLRTERSLRQQRSADECADAVG